MLENVSKCVEACYKLPIYVEARSELNAIEDDIQRRIETALAEYAIKWDGEKEKAIAAAVSKERCDIQRRIDEAVKKYAADRWLAEPEAVAAISWEMEEHRKARSLLAADLVALAEGKKVTTSLAHHVRLVEVERQAEAMAKERDRVVRLETLLRAAIPWVKILVGERWEAERAKLSDDIMAYFSDHEPRRKEKHDA